MFRNIDTGEACPQKVSLYKNPLIGTPPQLWSWSHQSLICPKNLWFYFFKVSYKSNHEGFRDGSASVVKNTRFSYKGPRLVHQNAQGNEQTPAALLTWDLTPSSYYYRKEAYMQRTDIHTVNIPPTHITLAYYVVYIIDSLQVSCWKCIETFNLWGLACSVFQRPIWKASTSAYELKCIPIYFSSSFILWTLTHLLWNCVYYKR